LKELKADIAVIGGGPAGMAAAAEAERAGVENVILLERDYELGGVLQQCIHDGFGLHRFKKRMSGTQYAQYFIDDLEKSGVNVMLDTMVIDITKNKEIFACNKVDGIIRISARTIILAMGCRERTAGQILLFGHRPAGVMTAGSLQRYINMEGYLPGKRAVVLGSGDIGLIMARRMILEKMEVEGVYEVMKIPGGLTRNIVQCLEDYGIPLHLSSTVTRVHGKNVLEGVTVAGLNDERKIIPGSERYVACDLLALAVGLIPENELSLKIGVKMDPRTKGPVLDSDFMTSVPGVFAAGNVAVVFDLVDYVSDSAEIAARGAVKYLRGEIAPDRPLSNVFTEGNIDFVVPRKITSNPDGDIKFFMRVREPQFNAVLTCKSDGGIIGNKRIDFATPPEMIEYCGRVSDGRNVVLKVESAL